MEFRWLDGNDAVDALNPILEREGWTPLNGATARALVAEEDGVLVAFFCLQLFPLLGPLYCKADARDGQVSRALVDKMHEFLTEIKARGYMAVCDSPVSEKMCRMRGMKKIESPVYLEAGC